jgi:hypothetical protein
LDNALTDKELYLPGKSVTAYTNGTLEGIILKLDSQTNDAVYLNEFNPLICADGFTKLYLTTTAQANKYLRILVGWDTGTRAAIREFQAQISKPVLGAGQASFELLVTRRAADGDAIAAGAVAAIDAYEVPEGYQLHIGGAIITCNASCIQKVVMCHTPGIIGDYLYDVKGELIFGDLSSTIIASGETLTIYIFNNDTVERDFSVTVVGVLESV